MRFWQNNRAIILLGSLLLASGCQKKDRPAQIRIDGSGTVFPITEAVAEEFQKKQKSRITIGVSGTGGGFKKFCSDGLSMVQASRPIKPTEANLCAQNQVEYIELPIAYDGIVVVVHPKNDWVNDVSILDLKKIWEPAAQGKIMKWRQVHQNWPNEEIHLFAPGVDSGTYDYFTNVVVGTEHASRGDVTSSEDDNVLVQGVGTDKFSLGFFGFVYYAENKNRLKVLSLDGVTPTFSAIKDGKYQPLSRPIFIYINKKQADVPDVVAFVDFYLKEGIPLIEQVGYVPLSIQAYDLVIKRFEQRVVGSIFSGVAAVDSHKVEQILSGAANGLGS